MSKRFLVFIFSLIASPLSAGPQQDAKRLLDRTGIQGGLVVHLGCGDGRLTAALHANESFVVHGMDEEATHVMEARKTLQGKRLHGPVTVERLESNRLPHAENLVNLLVVGGPHRKPGDPPVPEDEILRVLVPGGKACLWEKGDWRVIQKDRPEEMDEWTHYLHDSTNNPVSHDTIVGPPRHLQWVGSPRWSRHHDRTASMSALVSSNGRIFYIMDEGSRACVQLPSHWRLRARDAFNGTPLWQREIPEWHNHLWPLKSGPVQPTRRLVSVGDTVYVTLGLHEPVTALDGATGRTLRTYARTRNTEEILYSNGTLFLLVYRDPTEEEPFVPDRSGVWNDTKRVAKNRGWNEEPRMLRALDADTGRLEWKREAQVAPMTLTVDGQRVYFFDGERVHSLDRGTGEPLWTSGPVSKRRHLPHRFGPNLIAYEDVLLFTAGDRRMKGLNASSGEILWDEEHPPSGHCSQEDLMVVGGLVWSADIAGGTMKGLFRGLNPRTGEVERSFAPDVETYWFHHRCYRSKATDRFLLPSRTGIEFVDFSSGSWDIHHWVRGGCIYGIMPCNGLVYAPPHDCACYLESKLFGFNALTSSLESRRVEPADKREGRLIQGPAYGFEGSAQETDGVAEWSTYRGTPSRSGAVPSPLSPDVQENWSVSLPGKLSAPVVGQGKVVVSVLDNNTLHALDLSTGEEVWQYTANGTIDSPPTLYRGTALFGSCDGWVRSLRLKDGALIWRFRACPRDLRIMAFEKLESVWPIHGNVLVYRDPELDRDVLVCVAGRSMFLDGGLRIFRLDPLTGQLLSEKTMNETDPTTGKNLQGRVQVLNMPVALPDILSTDGRYLYMRSQRLLPNGERQEETMIAMDPSVKATQQAGEDRHLFCPAGFLDGDWFHRSYWLYGRLYSSGCNWWANAGRFTPAGRILAYDDEWVYGYGRKPSYFQWSVPLDYHLFRCPKDPEVAPIPQASPSVITVEKSDSLNPAGSAFTVELWLKAEGPDGTVFARGGASHGYSLALSGGQPCFGVRIDGEVYQVKSPVDVQGRWSHLCCVLTKNKELLLYVDGQATQSARAPSFLTADPHEAMQLGTDQGSQVMGQDDSIRLRGLVDEFRIYQRDLDASEIQEHAKGHWDETARKQLVLHFSFDDGDAVDLSGNKNHGGVGTQQTEGRFGQAMAFDGKGEKTKDIPTLKRQFQYDWTRDFPIHVRAMVLTDKVLFVAGPADVLDEEASYRQPYARRTQSLLKQQDAHSMGRKGGSLLAVDATTGQTMREIQLDAPPVWDSLAAAKGALVLCTLDGRVLCFQDGPQQPE